MHIVIKEKKYNNKKSLNVIMQSRIRNDTVAVYQIAVTLVGSNNLLVTDGIWALD